MAANVNGTTQENKINPNVMGEHFDGSQENLVSSTSLNDEHDIVIVEETHDPHSVTGILDVCKRKLLRPYMRFLSLVGLRPIFFGVPANSAHRFLVKCLNYSYNLQVFLFLITGYVLQYMACFCRDRGFGSLSSSEAPTKYLKLALYNESCNSNITSSFILPGVLHLTGYIYALIVFRRTDDDQLPVLIERVFLSSSHVPNMIANQGVIVRTLWIFVISSFLWMLSSMALVISMMAEGDIIFKWLDDSYTWEKVIMKTLLVVCIIWHDIVQASVISNYCLQAQLLKSYVQSLREKLLQQSIKPLEWIRDIEEFRKLLTYLNKEVSPAVCIFTVLNWTYAISGTLWLLTIKYNSPEYSVPLSSWSFLANVILWWVVAIVPFIQAARLTTACDNVKTVGQEVRTRPFAHQDTPLQELNSILIYTSSLKIRAKLFNLPITGKYTGISFAILATYFLVIGQSKFFPR